MKSVLSLILILALAPGCNKNSNNNSNQPSNTPPAAKSQTWRMMAFQDNLNLEDASFFVLNNKGYILKEKSVYTYDPSTNKLEQIGDFPGDTRHALPLAFTNNNKGYYGLGYARLTGGGFSGEKNDLWELDPATNTWSRKKDVQDYLELLGHKVATTNSGKTYVRSTTRVVVYSYDAVKDEWKYISSKLNPNVSQAVFFSYKNKILLDGVQVPPGSDQYNLTQSGSWEMDLSTNLWTKKTTQHGLPRNLRRTWASLNKCIALMEGGSSAVPGQDLYEFNPDTEKWTMIPYSGIDLTKISLVEGFNIGNKLYTILHPTKNRAEIWEYTY